MESGGRYDAVGSLTDKGQRAYGKYQIMDYNIPVWSYEVLGVAYTVDEFMADHYAQDLIAQVKITKHLSKYSPHDVASIWFTGGTVAKNGHKTDINGTSGIAYVNKVINLMK